MQIKHNCKNYNKKKLNFKKKQKFKQKKKKNK